MEKCRRNSVFGPKRRNYIFTSPFIHYDNELMKCKQTFLLTSGLEFCAEVSAAGP